MSNFGEDYKTLATTIDEHSELMQTRLLLNKLLNDNNSKLAPPRRGNPAVVGLAGFGASTLCNSFVNLGWISPSPVVYLAIIFGGLAQLIAGFLEFSTGNNFPFCTFTTFGSFWMCMGGIVASKKFPNFYQTDDTDLGAFLLVFTLLTLILWVASAKLNANLFGTFTLLIIGFVCLDVAHLARVEAMHTAAAVVLILCALMAWYGMAHIIFLEVNQGKDLLPLGPSPYKMLKNRFGKMKVVRDSDQESPPVQSAQKGW